MNFMTVARLEDAGREAHAQLDDEIERLREYADMLVRERNARVCKHGNLARSCER